MWKKWAKEDDLFILNNYGKLTLKEICDNFPNRTRGAILKRGSDLGVSDIVKNMRDSKKKYSLNDHFFDVPNNNNSYWAGFIAADGNFGKDNELRILLNVKDICVLEKLKTTLEYNGPIRVFSRNGFEYCSIAFFGCHNTFEKITKNWNIPQKRKTYNITHPNLEDSELIYSFIVGLIDGDGAIYTCGRKGRKKITLYFSLCGSYKMMDWCSKELKKIVDVSLKLHRTNKWSDACWTINCSANKAKILLNYLNNIPLDFKLERKWCKIKDE